jgi:hypothetical protein
MYPSDEATDCTVKRHPRAVRAPIGHASELRMGIVQLEMTDDEVAVVFIEMRQGLTVDGVFLVNDDAIER